MTDKQNLVWIDLEMTGLDPHADTIIEIACVITNTQLDVIAEGPCLAISQPQSVMDKMDEWNKKTHAESGLIQRVLSSNVGITDAAQATLDFVSKYTKSGRAALHGNSVHQDRHFLQHHMPELHAHFHYRIVDVSSVALLARMWYPQVESFKKQKKHQALEDIHESINQLKYLKQHIFRIC